MTWAHLLQWSGLFSVLVGGVGVRFYGPVSLAIGFALALVLWILRINVDAPVRGGRILQEDVCELPGEDVFCLRS